MKYKEKQYGTEENRASSAIEKRLQRYYCDYQNSQTSLSSYEKGKINDFILGINKNSVTMKEFERQGFYVLYLPTGSRLPIYQPFLQKTISIRDGNETLKKKILISGKTAKSLQSIDQLDELVATTIFSFGMKHQEKITNDLMEKLLGPVIDKKAAEIVRKMG